VKCACAGQGTARRQRQWALRQQHAVKATWSSFGPYAGCPCHAGNELGLGCPRGAQGAPSALGNSARQREKEG
jgi:hypothetical protein